MSAVTVVTGAGRGLGLEMARLRLEAGDTVVATARTPSPALGGLGRAHPGRLHVLSMDVADPASIREAAEHAAERVDHVDLLVNNAGVLPRGESLDTLDPEKLVGAFRINAVGPILVVRAFLPLLRRGTGKRLLQLTSLMGSMGDNRSGKAWSYRLSKAALNMAVLNLAHELGPEGFVAVAVHPGWVRTAMGGDKAPLAPDQAAAEVLRVGLSATRAENGAFLGPGGTVLPY